MSESKGAHNTKVLLPLGGQTLPNKIFTYTLEREMLKRPTEINWLTGVGLGDNGRMVMGVVTSIEVMVVQSSVKPVVEELSRTPVK